MTRVLVIGASRGIGEEVVRQAIASEHSVCAMARNVRSLTFSSRDLEKISGDALRPDDVNAALKDVDVVVQALGIPLDMNMFVKPVSLFSEATRVLVSGMKQTGVRRLISVTGFGAGDSRARINCVQRAPFKLLLSNAYDDKTIQEDIIEKSQLDWTIVRPGILTSWGKSGDYKVLANQEQWRNGVISRADVADFIVGQFDSGSMIGKKPVLIRFPL